MSLPENHQPYPKEFSRLSKEMYDGFLSLVTEPGYLNLPLEIADSIGSARWSIDVGATATRVFLDKNTFYEDMTPTIDNGETAIYLERQLSSGRLLTIPRVAAFILKDMDTAAMTEPEADSVHRESSDIITRILLEQLDAFPRDGLFETIDRLLSSATTQAYNGAAHWKDPDPSGVTMLASYTFCKDKYSEVHRSFIIESEDENWVFRVATTDLIGDPLKDRISYEELNEELDICTSPGEPYGSTVLTPDRLQEIYKRTMHSLDHGRRMARMAE